MNVEIEIIKGIPKEQIEQFEDRVVYNVAVTTREFTKSKNAFPYLTGTLRREEVAAPIIGSNKEYGLTTGVDYAIYVWKFKNPKWTNPDTKPQWYKSVYEEKKATILNEAIVKAKKEI